MSSDEGRELLQGGGGKGQGVFLGECSEGERSEGRGREDDGEDGGFGGIDVEWLQRVDRGAERG